MGRARWCRRPADFAGSSNDAARHGQCDVAASGERDRTLGADLAIVVSDLQGRIVGTNARARSLPCAGERRCSEFLSALPNVEGLPCAPGCAARLGATEGCERRQRFRAAGRELELSCTRVGDRIVSLVLPSATRLDPRVRETITAREREVLELLSEGVSATEIAAHLGVGHGTVRTHLQHLREKLGCSTQAGIVGRAFRLKLLP